MDIVQRFRNRLALEALVALSVICMADLSFAARPLIIDDADPLDFQQFKIEAGGWYEKDSNCHDWDWPVGLGYGLLPGLEVDLGLGGTFQQQTEIDEQGAECVNSESGFGDMVLCAKWQFWDESTWIPRQAVVPTVKFPTADKNKGLGSGKFDYDLTWIASKAFTPEMGGHVNVGYSFIGKPADEDVGDILHCGAALDYQIADPLQWVGEVYAGKELMSGTDHVVMGNTGLRWNPLDGLVLDAAAGTHLSSAGPDLTATAGLTWTFGLTKKESK